MNASPSTSEHIVKSYDEELKRLTGEIQRMGEIALAQLDAAIDAVMERDSWAGDPSAVRECIARYGALVISMARRLVPAAIGIPLFMGVLRHRSILAFDKEIDVSSMIVASIFVLALVVLWTASELDRVRVKGRLTPVAVFVRRNTCPLARFRR